MPDTDLVNDHGAMRRLIIACENAVQGLQQCGLFGHASDLERASAAARLREIAARRETLAWALVGPDGRVLANSVGEHPACVEWHVSRTCGGKAPPGYTIARVAIRRVGEEEK